MKEADQGIPDLDGGMRCHRQLLLVAADEFGGFD